MNLKVNCPNCLEEISCSDGEAPSYCPFCEMHLKLKPMVFEFGHLEEAPAQFTGKGFDVSNKPAS